MSTTIHVVGRQSTRCFFAALLLATSIISPSNVVHAQTITPVHTKLTPDAVIGGSFGLHRITADGSRLVYLADQDTAGVVEIYSVPISGGAAIKLNGALAEGLDVSNFAISPDGNHVVFDVRPNSTDIVAVYSAPITGGTAVNLIPNVPSDSNIIFLAYFNPFSPDSQHVIYRFEKKDTFLDYALFSVAIGGGTPVPLNPTLVEGGQIFNFTVSQNSQRVIYSATQDNASFTEMYSVPISGGSTTKLNVALASGENVDSGYFTVSETRAVYFVSGSSDKAIYSVPIGGGESIKINDVAGSPTILWSTLDNTVFIYAIVSGTVFNGDASYTLYAKSLSGGDSLPISSSTETEGVNSSFEYVIQFSGDGQQVFFVVGTASGPTIYHASITGGSNVKVATPLTGPGTFQLSADNSKVVIGLYNQFGGSDLAQLSALDVASGQATPLDEVHVSSYFYWRFSPDQKGVIYFGKKDGSPDQLFYAPIAGGAPTVINVAYLEIEAQLTAPSVEPFVAGDQVCVVYGFKYSESTSRSLHSSCFGTTVSLPNRVYLPTISR